MTTIKLNIEQNDFSAEFELKMAEPTLKQLANVVLNNVLSYLAIDKLTKSVSDRAKLNLPFTFALAVEQDGKEYPIEFSSKLSFTERGIDKLVANFPKVLAHLIISPEMAVSERMKAIIGCESREIKVLEGFEAELV